MELITNMGLNSFLTMMHFLGMVDFGSYVTYNDAVSNIVAGLKLASNGLKLVGAALAVCYIMWAGYQFMFGGPNGAEQGKKYLLNVAIGLVLIFGAAMIADWIVANLATGF